MMEQQYEALDSEQSSRAAALEIAATHTAEVVEHLDHTSKYGSVKDAPKGGLRGVFSQIVDGEPPKGSTEFSESSFSTFGDVTMRFAQWIELGFDTDKIDLDDDEEAES
ncbi:MAG: hypothetical protein L0H03_18870 [Rhodococcus sp. (in: high G+C Gram-positive bacteria)]|nr:hypothetical protein [Rhodococcus sp. (in: high G+C Gram-positive bacteria)]